MAPRTRPDLAARVAQAAAAALKAHGYVCAVEVLLALTWLSPRHLQSWREGQLPCLEDGIQTASKRVTQALHLLDAWARAADLEPTPGSYVARNVARDPLRFSRSGSEERELLYRTHWVSKDLPAAKRARTLAKADRPPEIIVVAARHEDWVCQGCSKVGGDLLTMATEGTTCLECAGLGDLVFLAAGNTKLTRRARAHSERTAVVVRWSQSRKRNERIGVLVEAGALAKAEASLET